MADLALIQRLAPLVRLHPADRYRPSAVDRYLPHVRMRFDRSWKKDRQLLGVGEVHDGTIAVQRCEGQHSGSERPSDFFLEICGDQEAVRGGDLASATCYVHTIPGPGYEDLQYWFFYAYNGDMAPGPVNFAHEGDWEHVTLRVAGGRIERVFFAAHRGEGRPFPANACTFVGDRVIVYSAKHSHASYRGPGKQARNNLPDDHTADGGPEWPTWERLVWLDAAPPAWLRYSGRWGEIGNFNDTSGPYGPSHQRAYAGDPELGAPRPPEDPGDRGDDPRGGRGDRGDRGDRIP